MILGCFTPIGFPYRSKTNGHRVAYLVSILYRLFSVPFQSNQFPFRFQQVRNMFYEYDGTLSKDESGYLFSFQDRREERPLLGTNVNLTGLVSIKSKCETEMMCGMPLYDYRFTKSRLQSKWLPRSEPIVPPEIRGLELLNKTILNATNVRFEFNLTGPSHMSLFIQPYDNVKISNWSFIPSYLNMPPPYHIYLTYGIDNSPYNFFVEASVINTMKICTFQYNRYIYIIHILAELTRRLGISSISNGSICAFHWKRRRCPKCEIRIFISVLLNFGPVACII